MSGGSKNSLATTPVRLSAPSRYGPNSAPPQPTNRKARRYLEKLARAAPITNED